MNAAALIRLRSEKTDAHVASFFKFDSFPSSMRTELCEAPASVNKAICFFDNLKTASTMLAVFAFS